MVREKSMDRIEDYWLSIEAVRAKGLESLVDSVRSRFGEGLALFKFPLLPHLSAFHPLP
jgi:hypothetical protein